MNEFVLTILAGCAITLFTRYVRLAEQGELKPYYDKIAKHPILNDPIVLGDTLFKAFAIFLLLPMVWETALVYQHYNSEPFSQATAVFFAFSTACKYLAAMMACGSYKTLAERLQLFYDKISSPTIDKVAAALLIPIMIYYFISSLIKFIM